MDSLREARGEFRAARVPPVYFFTDSVTPASKPSLCLRSEKTPEQHVRVVWRAFHLCVNQSRVQMRRERHFLTYCLEYRYAEFRWAEVIGAPEPPTHQTISGWQVHYPFDAVLNEEPAVTSERSPQKTTQKQPAEGLSVFGSSSKELDQAWELTRHTIAAAALDLNTDSNTRQRDLCTLDAWLATRYQAGVAPGTSAHLRRRVTRNMYEPNGFVNYWTEFLV